MYDQWASTGSMDDIVTEVHEASVRKRILSVVAIVVILIVLFAARTALGDYKVDFFEVYGTIWGHLTGGSVDAMTYNVIWEQRLPRVLTAVFAGAGLAAGGAAMQSMMKNPLADAYTTGISSGALFGATLAMTMGYALVDGYYGRVLNAFIFAMVPAAVIVLISRWKRPSPALMILAGIAIMYIFNAFQSFMMLRVDPNSASSVYTWSVGSVGMTTWEQIPALVLVTIVGSLALFAMSRVLNAMNSGDEYAKSLGIPVDRMRVICLVLISLVAAGIVSFTGVIGFIGLVSPHIARMFVGSDNRILIPMSALMGASLMLFCDILGFVLVGATLQIGIVTAMVGGPLFLIILLAKKGEVWRRRYPQRISSWRTGRTRSGTGSASRSGIPG